MSDEIKRRSAKLAYDFEAETSKLQHRCPRTSVVGGDKVNEFDSADVFRCRCCGKWAVERGLDNQNVCLECEEIE